MSISVRIPAAAIGVDRRVTPSLWFGPALYAAGGMLLVFLVGQIGKRLPESVLKLFPSSEPETVRGVLNLRPRARLRSQP